MGPEGENSRAAAFSPAAARGIGPSQRGVRANEAAARHDLLIACCRAGVLLRDLRR